MSLTLSVGQLPAHTHFVANSDDVDPNSAPVTSGLQVTYKGSTGSIGSYVLGGSASTPTRGNSSSVGSGTAIDTTPAHVKVAIYRRSA